MLLGYYVALVPHNTPSVLYAVMQMLLCSDAVSGLSSQSGRDAESAKKSQTLVCSTTQKLTVCDDNLWFCHVWLKVAHRRYNSCLDYFEKGEVQAQCRHKRASYA